jgi:hypothetical protein
MKKTTTASIKSCANIFRLSLFYLCYTIPRSTFTIDGAFHLGMRSIPHNSWGLANWKHYALGFEWLPFNHKPLSATATTGITIIRKTIDIMHLFVIQFTYTTGRVFRPSAIHSILDDPNTPRRHGVFYVDAAKTKTASRRSAELTMDNGKLD